ncbi:MAG: hypothetical protein VX278_19850 [Myxococcota bacterium]|nr:hypothetical protein [Myxococcota bacterium]
MLFFLFACGMELPKTTIDRTHILNRSTRAICDSLLQCCDEQGQTDYFRDYQDDPRLQSLQASLPPSQFLDEETCPPVVEGILLRTWLGDWLDKVERGLVHYDPTEAAECIRELEEAECGSAKRDALRDPTCFGLLPPSDGTLQRRMFRRSSLEGDTCMPIDDGITETIFGSCNPEHAFCCVEDEDLDGCSPFPLPEQSGNCIEIASEGETCSPAPPISPCKLGLACERTSGTCISLDQRARYIGDPCYDDENLLSIGSCADGWCDIDGSQTCEALRDIGDSCILPISCRSQYCDTETATCLDNPICIGVEE